ncbi:hypothetical protein N656DRAFT_765615 [Canariomyces notabilis]|uniref:Protein phosphatase 4 core regulatory subunit R2 n=1 Tax=Canariomyces notabilis TaxID=2074819 RepID=A0AAN6YWJ7_9PEZI|nr:hypothetical protein N656DRAFT_765615 [Canariomyces arenarius]
MAEMEIELVDDIAHTEFTIPNIPPPRPIARPPSPRFLAPLLSSDPLEPADSSDTSSSSQEGNKENTSPPSRLVARNARNAPTSITTRSALLPSPAPSQSQSQPQPQPQPEPHPVQPASDSATTTPPQLPKPIADMLDEIVSVLRTNFAEYPPHTIQRLAELVLRPKQHYRSVVAYLHALDRVVHVTSGANIYPLPPAVPDMSAMSILANGVSGDSHGRSDANAAAGVASSGAGGGGGGGSSSGGVGVGSDEALGGALLTPIPWLTRRRGAANGEDGEDGEGSEAGSEAGSEDGGPPIGPVDIGPQSQQFAFQQGAAGGGGRPLEGRVRTESTETIEGPNGMGRIETVSVSVNGIPSTGAGVAAVLGAGNRAVTQGELLRQEQRAGVVPLSQLNRQQQQQQQVSRTADANSTASEDAHMSDQDGEEDGGGGGEGKSPPAPGPEGAAPTTTVERPRIDVEAAVGRSSAAGQQTQKPGRASKSPENEIVPRSPKREAAEELEPAGASRKRVREDDSGASSSSNTAEQQAQEGKDKEEEIKTADQPSDTASGAAGADAETEPKRDAEGDLVLTDLAAGDEAVAGPSKDPPAEAEKGGSTTDEPAADTTKDGGGKEKLGAEQEVEDAAA